MTNIRLEIGEMRLTYGSPLYLTHIINDNHCILLQINVNGVLGYLNTVDGEVFKMIRGHQ